jgi:hypothetical protein
VAGNDLQNVRSVHEKDSQLRKEYRSCLVEIFTILDGAPKLEGAS